MQLLFSGGPLYFQVKAFLLGFTCSQVFHTPCGFCFFLYKDDTGRVLQPFIFSNEYILSTILVYWLSVGLF